MPAILNDDPTLFEGDLDLVIHEHVREALLALNRHAFARRGAPGLTVRSVIEDGAVAGGPDCLAAFQATVDAVAAAGGGIALVPAGGVFHWIGTLTIPHNVILRGLGDRSVLMAHAVPEPQEPGPAIRFAPGKHLGGVEDLILYGNLEERPTIGIDLTGAQFLRLRNFQVWDFPLGICLSDGETQFAGCNHVSDFEINSCHVGLRAWLPVDRVAGARRRPAGRHRRHPVAARNGRRQHSEPGQHRRRSAPGGEAVRPGRAEGPAVAARPHP